MCKQEFVKEQRCYDFSKKVSDRADKIIKIIEY